MKGEFAIMVRRSIKFIIGLLPLLITMYGLYALDINEIWTAETAHRDKITIVIVAIAMACSFVIFSHFIKRDSVTR